MKMDFWQLIVVVFFVVVWVVNQVLNKEVRPAPRMPAGPRPDRFPQGPPRELDQPRLPGTVVVRPRPPGMGQPEEIVILEVDTRPPGRGPAAAPRPNASARSRRAARRPGGGPAGRSEPARSKRPEEPKTSLLTATASSLTAETTPVPEVSSAGRTPPPQLLALRERLADPEQLRQAFLLGTILQPPPALVRWHRRR